MPPRRSTPQVYERAHQLRKEPTAAETKLWAYLRGNKLNGVNFRRQHAIGKYIADFCAIKMKLVIELDGSQHRAQEAYDEERTSYLAAHGYKVIRFLNHQVMNDLEGVIKTINFELATEEQIQPG